MPITGKRRDDESGVEHTFKSFVHRARWFVVSQMIGSELGPVISQSLSVQGRGITPSSSIGHPGWASEDLCKESVILRRCRLVLEID